MSVQQEIKKIAVMVYTMAVKSVSGKTNTLLLILVAEWLILTLPIDINFVDSSPFQNLPPLPGENAMCTWCSELELEDEPKEETSLLELIRCSTNMLRFWWRYAHLSRWVIDLWKSPKVIDIIHIYTSSRWKKARKNLANILILIALGMYTCSGDSFWHSYIQLIAVDPVDNPIFKICHLSDGKEIESMWCREFELRDNRKHKRSLYKYLLKLYRWLDM